MAGGRILLIAAFGLLPTAAVPAVLAATSHGPATRGCTPGTDQAALRGTGVPARSPGSWEARLSNDGRYVAFASYAEDLVAGDTNQQADVFRMDRATREIIRVSLDTGGEQYQDHAAETSISADGASVAFSAGYSVYVRDIGAARTVHASVDNAGAEANDWSGAPVVSPAGRYVAFTSRATNLVAADRDWGSIEVYLRDLEAETTERISLGAGGPGAPTWSWAEAVSEEGRYVAFTAGAAGGSLAPEDTYPGADVFVRDRHAQATELISVGPDGRSIGGWFLGMSADGMRILFGSGPQPDAKPAVFLRDRAARTTRIVAPLVTTWRRSAGTHPAPLAFIAQRRGSPAVLSPDGQFAAIQTALPTGPDDTNGADDIVIVDLATDARQPATLSSGGCPGNGASGEPTFSGDGSMVGFTSEADDLAGSDNGRHTNVYVRDLTAGRTERISTPAPSTT
jgi:Tol biopolymer transport system component